MCGFEDVRMCRFKRSGSPFAHYFNISVTFMSFLRHRFAGRIMKKQFFIRVLMLVAIISAGVFVVAAVRADHPARTTDECSQEKEECFQPRTHSEFLLESLTRTLLSR
jgi:hypothetical protein